MKTLITIVIDEDKENFGWRLDRSNDDAFLLKKAECMIQDTFNNSVTPDALVAYKPISAITPSVVDTFVKQIKEQMESYQLLSEDENELVNEHPPKHIPHFQGLAQQQASLRSL